MHSLPLGLIIVMPFIGLPAKSIKRLLHIQNSYTVILLISISLACLGTWIGFRSIPALILKFLILTYKAEHGTALYVV